jgi:hypothetical protein
MRRRRTVLFGAAVGFHHDLFELAIDLGRWECFVRQRSVPREDPMVGWDARGELG